MVFLGQSDPRTVATVPKLPFPKTSMLSMVRFCLYLQYFTNDKYAFIMTPRVH